MVVSDDRTALLDITTHIHEQKIPLFTAGGKRDELHKELGEGDDQRV